MIGKLERIVKTFRKIVHRLNGEFMRSVACGTIYGNVINSNGGGNFINYTI